MIILGKWFRRYMPISQTYIYYKVIQILDTKHYSFNIVSIDSTGVQRSMSRSAVERSEEVMCLTLDDKQIFIRL